MSGDSGKEKRMYEMWAMIKGAVADEVFRKGSG
jgi:hypothetical protein